MPGVSVEVGEMAGQSTELVVGGLRILQLNCQRARHVMHDLGELMMRESMDVGLIQEPWNVEGRMSGIPAGMRRYESEGGKAGVIVRNDEIECVCLSEFISVYGVCVWINGPCGSMFVVSVYCRPGEPARGALEFLDRVFQRVGQEKVIVGMDANASSGMWMSKMIGNVSRDKRERACEIEQWIERNNVRVLNEPSEVFTFSGPRGQSDIDITLSKNTDEWDIKWMLREEWGMSDHNVIVVDVLGTQQESEHEEDRTWTLAGAEWNVFEAILRGYAENMGYDEFRNMSVREMVRELTEWIWKSSDECLKRVKGKKKGKLQWWTRELEMQRRLVANVRRRYQRSRRREGEREREMNELRQYRVALAKYKNMLAEAKEKNWREYVGKERMEPWGIVYKILRGKRVKRGLSGLRVDGGMTVSWRETAEVLMEVFFPRETEERMPRMEEVVNGEMDEEFGWEEIRRAVRVMKNGKAPGMDGIKNETLRHVWRAVPEYVKSVFDACLRVGEYPEEWKQARVVVLPKGGNKDPSKPGSYRPICLLNGLGKLLERMMVDRMTNRMHDVWNEYQYGFRSNRCTEDVWMKIREWVATSERKHVCAIFVDFKGAFDNLRWDRILERLIEVGCSGAEMKLWRSYFENRKVCMRSMSGREVVWKTVERGCPQGSIGGPSIWNLCMDELLNDLNESGKKFAAFADDLTILVEARNRVGILSETRECMRRVCEWGRKFGVGVSYEKTVAMSLKGDLVAEGMVARVHDGGEYRSVRFVNEVKLLGVKMGRGMNFRVHLSGMRGRVENTMGALRRVLRKEWGMSRRVARTWMVGLVEAGIMYGASVWADMTRLGYVRVELIRCQRLTLYASMNVCRTVSTEAMQVLLGSPPWDLVCLKRRTDYRIGRRMRMDEWDLLTEADIEGKDVDECREMSRDAMERRWQERWNECTKGRVTYQFVSDVRFVRRNKWFDFGLKVGFILTGHGSLNEFLFRRGLSPSAACVCGGGDETWMHFLCECEMYECFRNLTDMGVERSVGVDGRATWDVSHVLERKEMYDALKKFVVRAYDMRQSVIERMRREDEGN